MRMIALWGALVYGDTDVLTPHFDYLRTSVLHRKVENYTNLLS